MLTKRLNLNNVLLVFGLAATFVPDLLELSAALAKTGIAWLVWVAKGLGALALLLAGISRAIPRMRPLLAAIGLATPPGATEKPTSDKDGEKP